MGFPSGSDGKESACNVGDWVGSFWEYPLEEGIARYPLQYGFFSYKLGTFFSPMTRVKEKNYLSSNGQCQFWECGFPYFHSGILCSVTLFLQIL